MLCAYCAFAGCKKPDAPPIAESSTTANKVEASTTLVSSIPLPAGDKHFIGSDACQSCHTDHHQSWHASFHRTMTQPINPATAPQAIIDNEVVVAGKKYRFERKDGDFLVTHLDSLTGAESEYRLVMMTGSHHMHVFWVDSGIEKTPDMLPIVFLLDQQKWIPRESAFLRTRQIHPTNPKEAVGIVFAANAIRHIPNPTSKRMVPMQLRPVGIRKSLSSASVAKLVMVQEKSTSRSINLPIRFHLNCPIGSSIQ